MSTFTANRCIKRMHDSPPHFAVNITIDGGPTDHDVMVGFMAINPAPAILGNIISLSPHAIIIPAGQPGGVASIPFTVTEGGPDIRMFACGWFAMSDGDDLNLAGLLPYPQVTPSGQYISQWVSFLMLQQDVVAPVAGQPIGSITPGQTVVPVTYDAPKFVDFGLWQIDCSLDTGAPGGVGPGPNNVPPAIPGGCTLNCRFCHTGTMRLVRNLEPSEIVGQVMLARDSLGEWPSQPEGRMLTNIVMMGMGEPLYNFDNVRDALKIVMNGDGLGLSKRRITLSTSGVVPMMARAGAEIGVNLAVSLHSVSKVVRDEIVPLNRKYGIEQLLEACAAYPGANNARRITFEYVMLKDKNDSDQDARELVRMIRKYRLPAKVNLIPFNPWPGATYECSSPERIRAFSNIVFEAGISAPVRTPRGRDIDAACGQLKTASERKRRA